MNANEIVQLIMNLGFPVVMCGVMAWYVYDTSNKHREDLSKINEQHKEEMDGVVQALNNNTIALQQLTDKLEISEEEK